MAAGRGTGWPGVFWSSKRLECETMCAILQRQLCSILSIPPLGPPFCGIIRYSITGRCRRGACCLLESCPVSVTDSSPPFWFLSLDVEARCEDQESSYFKLGLECAPCIVYNEEKTLCLSLIECEIVAIMVGRMLKAELALAETHSIVCGPVIPAADCFVTRLVGPRFGFQLFWIF